jgi:hypothetical protein
MLSKGIEMNEWRNFEREKPDLVFGNGYEFLTEIDTNIPIPVIWDGNDWYLIPFESILDMKVFQVSVYS